MNINELDNFQLTKAINFNTDLNPQLYVGEKMRPNIRQQLMAIADDFRQFLGVQGIALVDIEVSGSNAAYSYTPHSDIDLHLIVDFSQLTNDEIFRELFSAKQYQYNDLHDIKIKGYDVELYVQDAAQPHHSLGSYSVMHDDWNRIPTKQRANLNDTATLLKYEKLKDLSIRALATSNSKYVDDVLSTIKKYRQAGLDKHGEFGPENLAFKMIRTDGYFEKLWNKKREYEDQSLSLEAIEEDNTLAEQFMAEFNAVNEDGRVVKGSNTTQDVDVDEIKVQAKKMGFDVTVDGVPPIPKNGVPKLYEGVEQLSELNMSPGRLQKEVNKIISSANPIIGIEFEVVIPRDEEANPDIEYHTNLDDIKEFFTMNDSDADFATLENDYQEWFDEKQADWTHKNVEATLSNPAEASEKKIEFMIDDYVLSDDATDIIAEITNDEDDTEITQEMAEDVIARADQIYKGNGPADEWPTPSAGFDPYVRLYYEIFVEDMVEARDMLDEYYRDDFYNTEGYITAKYSVGRYLLDHHLSSMGDVFREYETQLYWPGGAMSADDFDEELAYQLAGELEDLIGETVSVEGSDSDVDTSQNWVVTSDPSIRPDGDGGNGDAGLEIVTPKMQYVDGINTLEEVFGYLENKGAYTNSSTGLHINVSLGNIDHSKLNYTKLVVMLGDAHILEQYDREFNEFAENSLTRLSAMMDATQGFSKDKAAKARSYADMMGKLKSDINNAVASSFAKVDFGKFSSVGIKENYIEFRSAGGADYLSDIDQTIAHINRFIIAYVVATDPDAYKKEYGKKLYKLASNVGKGQVPTTSMALFAKFNANMITKEELIKQLKAKHLAKQAEKPAPVDTGDAESPAFHELDSVGQAMMQVAWKHNLAATIAEKLWNQGIAVETSGRPPAQDPEGNVYNNLMNDPGYYK